MKKKEPKTINRKWLEGFTKQQRIIAKTLSVLIIISIIFGFLDAFKVLENPLGYFLFVFLGIFQILTAKWNKDNKNIIYNILWALLIIGGFILLIVYLAN